MPNVDNWVRAVALFAIRNEIQSPEEARTSAMALETLRLEEFLNGPEGRIALALAAASGRDIFLGRDSDTDTTFLLCGVGLVSRKGTSQNLNPITPSEAVRAAVRFGNASPTEVFSAIMADLDATAERASKRDL